MPIIYSKFNRDRKPEYQIATFIGTDGDNKFVWKKALTAEARMHISTIIRNYKILCGIHGEEHVVRAEQIDEDTIRFPYFEDPTWGREIVRMGQSGGKEALLLGLRKYYQFLKTEQTLGESREVDFSHSDGGDEKVNIDPHPDNILLLPQGPVIIDYEWLYSNAPLTFVFQRSVLNFYYNYYYALLKPIVTIEEIWSEFNITEMDKELYNKLEKDFSTTISAYDFTYQYQKKVVSFAEMTSLRKQVKNRLLHCMRKMLGR